MNRLAMLPSARHKLGSFVVLAVHASDQSYPHYFGLVLLRSGAKDFLALLGGPDVTSRRLPSLYQSIYALIVSVNFAGRQYRFIEEFTPLPDIY